MLDKLFTFILIGIIAMTGNWIGFDVAPVEGLPGMLWIILITI